MTDFNTLEMCLLKSCYFEIQFTLGINGNRLSTGLYCWVINYSYIDDGQQKSIIKSGNVTIIY